MYMRYNYVTNYMYMQPICLQTKCACATTNKLPCNISGYRQTTCAWVTTNLEMCPAIDKLCAVTNRSPLQYVGLSPDFVEESRFLRPLPLSLGASGL